MDENFFTGVFIFLWALAAVLVFVFPSVVAFRRNHPNRWIIFAINMAFGGTVIGWIGALVWAFNAAHRSNQADGSHGGESGLNIFINDEKRIRMTPTGSRLMADSSTVSNASIAIAELERLSRLHAAGHLADDEYGRLKTAVLVRV